jgi:hypothetical protein
MPTYLVRHVAERSEELSCLVQLEDECAAMYFNIVHGRKTRRRFTTQKVGERCEDYVLIAQDVKADGSMNERKITLFDLAGTLAT